MYNKYLDILGGRIPFIQEHRFMLKLPLTAWIAYFTIAYTIGKHYNIVAKNLLKYRWYTLIAVVISMVILYISYLSGNMIVSSRRFDLLPLVISVSAATIAWGQILPNLNIINLISNYSFGIYLVHWQVMRYIAPHTANFFIVQVPVS